MHRISDFLHELKNVFSRGMTFVYDKIGMFRGNRRITYLLTLEATCFDQSAGAVTQWIFKYGTGTASALRLSLFALILIFQTSPPELLRISFS